MGRQNRYNDSRSFRPRDRLSSTRFVRPERPLIRKLPLYKYCSTQFEIAEPLFSYLLRWTKRHVPFGALSASSWCEELHVTVRYGLASEDYRKLCDLAHRSIACEGATAFASMRGVLDEVQVFTSIPEHDVLCVRVLCPELLPLHDAVSEAVKLPQPRAPYSPHITLAYVKKGVGVALAASPQVRADPLSGRVVPLNNLVFATREGHKLPIRLRGLKKNREYRTKIQEGKIHECTGESHV